MNNQVKSFIENFIRENAKKDILQGYDLHAYCDLSRDDQDELISNLLNLDQENIRDIILDHAQNLIDERMPFIETEDRYEKGFISQVDPINGEITLSKLGGF